MRVKTWQAVVIGACAAAGCRGATSDDGGGASAAKAAAAKASANAAATSVSGSAGAAAATASGAAKPASAAPPRPKLEDAIAHAASAHRPLVLEFSTEWCKPCQIFAKTTLVDPRVAAALANVEFVQYDAEADPGVAAAARFGVNSYPTFLGVDAAGEVRLKSTGMQTGDEGVRQFVDFLGRSATATLDEAGLQARLAASPNDVSVHLVAAAWYAAHARAADAKAQYAAVAAAASATPEQRGLAASAASRIDRLARWRRELVAEKLALAEHAPKAITPDELATATVDSGAAPAAIHSAYAKVLAAQTDPDVINNLVYLALAAGAVDEALAAAKRAFADSKDAGRLDTLAECYHAHGDRAGALRVEDQALALAAATERPSLTANRKRFDAGTGDSREVARTHDQAAERWKTLAALDTGTSDDSPASAQPMPAEMAAAMAAAAAQRKLATAAGAACASSAGEAASAFAGLTLDPSGTITKAAVYLDAAAPPALRQCLTAQLVGAALPPGSELEPLHIELKAGVASAH